MGATDGLVDGIPYPDIGTPLTPLETHFAALADGAQEEINYLARGTALPVSSVVERNTLYPSPVGGETVTRLDAGWVEMYYPASMLAKGGAGWYPVFGRMPALASKPGNSGSGAASGWQPIGLNANYDYNFGGFTWPTASTMNVPFPGIYAAYFSGSFAGSNTGSSRGFRFVSDGITQGDDLVRMTTAAMSASDINMAISGTFAIATNLSVQSYHDASTPRPINGRYLSVRYLGPI